METPRTNFEIIRGTEFRVTFVCTLNGSANLTGYTIAGQIREHASDETIVATFTFTPAALDATGQAECVLTPAQTLSIAEGKYEYDARITKDGKPVYVTTGAMKFTTPVTR